MPFRSTIIAAFACLMLACTHAAAKDVPPAPEKSGAGFTYAETLENPGSKSAGVRGILTYKGLRILPMAGAIKTPIGTFVHRESNLLFRPQGWFPANDIIVPNTTEPVTSEMLQQGQYKGARRIGTPDDWCYLAASDTWTNPQKLISPGDGFPFANEHAPVKDRPQMTNANCRLKPERGPCKAIFEMYYFDAASNRCESFFWGGCQGVVPFKTMEACRKTCEKP